MIHDVAEELRSRGHVVETIALPDPFFPYEYDYDQYVFPLSYTKRRFGKSRAWSAAFGAIWRLSPRMHESLEKTLRRRMLRDADLYIRVWGTIPFDGDTLKSVARSKTKVASLLLGSDVRNYSVFSRQYGPAMSKIDPGPNDPSARIKLTALRTHEKYADAVFSVPDQMGLALRPYHHIQIPLRLDHYRYNVPGREIPKIVHAPSRPGVKGTDVIEATLAKLKSEGIEFEFISIRQMPHAQMLDVLSDADVLVDGLIVHGPGWLAFEAMASGCAVAVRHLGDSPECFRPPVLPIDSDDIEEKLRTLLTDRAMRVRLAEEGMRYVEKHNTVSVVVDELLRKIEAGASGTPDYVPRYLKDGFVPADAEEAALINELDELVRDEDWYEAYAMKAPARAS